MVKAVQTDSVIQGSVVKDTYTRQRGLFTGRVENLKMQQGILFHNKDIVHKADFTTQREINPQLIIAIPLESKALMIYGERHSLKNCRYRRSDPILATAIYYARPDRVEGAAKAHVRSRSIVLSLSTDWLQRQLSPNHRERFERNFCHHLSRFDWSLPPHLAQMAEVLNLTNSHNQAEDRIREAFSVAVWENLMQSIQHQSLQSVYRASPQSSRLKLFLRHKQAEDMSLEQIANALGMSVSTLQRTARKELGMSLQRYLRERQLHQVKALLEEGAVSIQRAAELAGYQHTANFITAFGKLFGYPPGQVDCQLANADCRRLC